MANGVSADRVNKIYEVACDGRSHLPGLLRRLNTVERKIELQTKHRESDRNTTPLITAAVRGNQNSVKTLLTYKADTEGRGTIKVDDHVVKACTPLWAAAAAGHLDVVQLIVEQKAKVDGRVETASTPFRAAVCDGRIDIKNNLVENGADINARKNDESTSLFPACCHDHTDFVECFLTHGANINFQDKDVYTALHLATRWGCIAIFDKLIGHGGLQPQNKNGLTPRLAASNHCKIELVSYQTTEVFKGRKN